MELRGIEPRILPCKGSVIPSFTITPRAKNELWVRKFVLPLDIAGFEPAVLLCTKSDNRSPFGFWHARRRNRTSTSAMSRRRAIHYNQSCFCIGAQSKSSHQSSRSILYVSGPSPSYQSSQCYAISLFLCLKYASARFRISSTNSSRVRGFENISSSSKARRGCQVCGRFSRSAYQVRTRISPASPASVTSDSSATTERGIQ